MCAAPSPLKVCAPSCTLGHARRDGGLSNRDGGLALLPRTSGLFVHVCLIGRLSVNPGPSERGWTCRLLWRPPHLHGKPSAGVDGLEPASRVQRHGRWCHVLRA